LQLELPKIKLFPCKLFLLTYAVVGLWDALDFPKTGIGSLKAARDSLLSHDLLYIMRCKIRILLSTIWRIPWRMSLQGLSLLEKFEGEITLFLRFHDVTMFTQLFVK